MVATATATAKPSAMASYRCFKILLLSVAGVFIFGMHRATAERNYATLTARREDIPFIRCRVCEVISKQLVRQVKEKRNKVAPRKITELEIINVAENICNMKKEGSDWILKLDIVENDGRLELVEQSVEGACKRDCKTTERACQEVMGEHDTDVAEYLYKAGSTRAGVMKLLCKDLSKACVSKLPPLPKDVPAGAPKMKFYSREDIQYNPGIAYSGGRSPRGPDDDEDEPDDDEDLEDDVEMSQAKPEVKTWRDSVATLGAKVGAQTQRVMQIASKTVNKATRHIKRWWYGKKPTAKSHSRFSAKRKASPVATLEEL